MLWAVAGRVQVPAVPADVDDGTTVHRVWATEARIANGSYHGGVELVESAELDSGEIVVQAVTGRSVVRPRLELVRDAVQAAVARRRR